MDVQVVDHEGRRRGFEFSEEFYQGFILPAEHVAQTDPAIARASLHWKALGAADCRSNRGGELLDAALQRSRRNSVTGTLQRDFSVTAAARSCSTRSRSAGNSSAVARS